MTHTPLEQALLTLLRQHSLRWGSFTLASGATSNHYLDVRTTSTHSLGAFLIGRILYDRTCNLRIDALGGMETGAIPLVTAAVMTYDQYGWREMGGFWVRNAIKEHGTRQWVEGNLKPGARVVLVEDVVTSGGSVIRALEAVREMGCQVVQVIALVDRLQGCQEALQTHGIPSDDFQAVFTIQDVLAGQGEAFPGQGAQGEQVEVRAVQIPPAVNDPEKIATELQQLAEKVQAELQRIDQAKVVPRKTLDRTVDL